MTVSCNFVALAYMNRACVDKLPWGVLASTVSVGPGRELRRKFGLSFDAEN